MKKSELYLRAQLAIIDCKELDAALRLTIIRLLAKNEELEKFAERQIPSQERDQ